MGGDKHAADCKDIAGWNDAATGKPVEVWETGESGERVYMEIQRHGKGTVQAASNVL